MRKYSEVLLVGGTMARSHVHGGVVSHKSCFGAVLPLLLLERLGFSGVGSPPVDIYLSAFLDESTCKGP